MLKNSKLFLRKEEGWKVKYFTSFFLLLLLSQFALSQELEGWATQNGGTTGGAGGTIVSVTTTDDLLKYAKSSEKMVIRIKGKINCNRIDLESNKTIEGIDGATINGSLYISGKAGAPKRNIIIRNISFVNESGTEDDVISMQYAENVWIDHCEICDARNSLDGLCDITHACNYITISWTKFYYKSNSADHRFCMLIGHSDSNEEEDYGKLKITLHHNWWADNVIERMPRMRFCQVHAFNNYYSSKGNNYCIGAGKKAQVIIESNYFENVKDPHIFYSGESTAIICVNNDNVYVNTSGKKDQRQGSCFTIPYKYNLDKGSNVKEIVMKGAGPQNSTFIRGDKNNLSLNKNTFTNSKATLFLLLNGRTFDESKEKQSSIFFIFKENNSLRTIKRFNFQR